MRRACILLIVPGLFAAIPARADMSGTYVGNGPALAVMVQIVETGGGKFTGRYEQVLLKAEGKIEDMNATISGAKDGETVVAIIRPAEFLAASVPVSGTYRAGLLHLSGGTGFVLNLTSGTEAGFRARVAALNAQGQRLIDAQVHQQAAERQAKLETDRLSKLRNLTGKIAAFNTNADRTLPKFAPVERQWRAITEKMRGGLARQQSIYGGGQAAVARAQITVALNQAAIEANQIRINTQTSYRTFEFDSGQLSREAAEANAWCQGSVAESLMSACDRLAEVETAFSKHVSALRAGFAELEEVWTAERREQEAIIETSQRLQ